VKEERKRERAFQEGVERGTEEGQGRAPEVGERDGVWPLLVVKKEQTVSRRRGADRPQKKKKNPPQKKKRGGRAKTGGVRKRRHVRRPMVSSATGQRVKKEKRSASRENCIKWEEKKPRSDKQSQKGEVQFVH